MSKLKITKITKSIPETAQLETFAESLGVKKKTEIYRCNSHYYINADLVAGILSVSLKDFLKTAESPLHYFTFKRQVFVNKYGLTKLLAESREKVAFQLQDYIYEVIYRLEKFGHVSTEDVETRKQLDLALAELETYKIAEVRDKLIFNEREQDIQGLSVKTDELEIALSRAVAQEKRIQSEYDELKKDYDKLYNDAQKLARYVKHCTRAKPKEALEILEDESDTEAADTDSIERDANLAKKQLSVRKKRGITKTTADIAKKVYYILRTPRPVINDLYGWELTSALPVEELAFKTASQEYELGDRPDPPFPLIWYCDAILTEDRGSMLTDLINLIGCAKCQTLDRILAIFA